MSRDNRLKCAEMDMLAEGGTMGQRLFDVTLCSRSATAVSIGSHRDNFLRCGVREKQRGFNENDPCP